MIDTNGKRIPYEHLKARCEELQARADAAEEALRAIQSVEVDAPVIYGEEGERVYTLEGADHTYRVMVESIQEGVATLQGDGTILYANQRLAQMLGVNLEALLGANLLPFVSPSEQQAYLGMLRRGLAGAIRGEIALRRLDGSSLPVLFSLTGVESKGAPVISLVATDLTEQKRQEEILASERLARSALEQASEAIVVCDLHGTIIRASQATYRISTDNPLFQPFEQIFQFSTVNGEDQAEDFSMARVLQGRVYQGVEVRLAANGSAPAEKRSSSYLLLSATPLRNEHEQIIGGIVSITDITERKQAEQTLRESQERLIMTAEAAEIGLWNLDIRTGTLYLDDQVKSVLCLAKDQPIDPVHIATFIQPEDLVQVEALVGRILQAPERLEVEFRVNRPDGSQCWLYMRGQGVFDSPGQPQQLMGVVMDITERKQMEEALRESQARFELVLRNSHISMYTTDCDRRYTWVYNPKSGLQTDEILGKRDEELLPPEDVAEVVELKQHVLQTGEGTRREVHFRKGGGVLVNDTSLEPIRSASGQVVGLMGVAVDITERRQLEEQMSVDLARLEVQRRLLEQREQERLQIARDLHDGPVQELTGATFTLRSLLMEQCAPEVTQQLEAIQQTLQAQIHELRTYAGELRPPALAKFGLVKAIQSHLETYQEKHPELNIVFEESQADGLLPEELRLAFFRIYQEAFVTNITKHARAARVAIRFVRTPEEAVLEIEDDGVGFTLPRDWLELARQGHLGLVGIRERTEAIGGTVEIASRPGQGTRMQVRVSTPRLE